MFARRALNALPKISRIPPSSTLSKAFTLQLTTTSPSTNRLTSQFRPMSTAARVVSTTGLDISLAKQKLLTCDCVCFDVDSTVITEEGIDVLAASLGKGEEVAEWTRKAMGGSIKFEDALAARLELIHPSRTSIESCLTEHPLIFSPHVQELIALFQSKGVAVWLVSGGFRIMIDPIAVQLNIPLNNVIANTIFFNEDGSYKDFCKNELTSRDMGKPTSVKHIMSSNNFKSIVMFGDGATDAQAKPPAEAFVGYGGVVEREAVVKKADWFIKDFRDVIDVVKQRA